MRERPIMISEVVHEKLMELKRSLEEKLDEQVSFNAFLLMMLEEFERLGEALRLKESEKPVQPYPEIHPDIPQPPQPYKQPYKWNPPIYKWTVQTTDTTTGTWYDVSGTGTSCPVCNHPSSVINGTCTNCGVSR